MKEDIEVVAVYADGAVKIYGSVGSNGTRPFVGNKKFSSYGKALQFAHEFEQRQLARQ